MIDRIGDGQGGTSDEGVEEKVGAVRERWVGKRKRE
jgi:hypothetical protein